MSAIAEGRVSAHPWFTNDRGQQVYRVLDEVGRDIGWFGPHPVGFYGGRDSWPCGEVNATKPTRAAMLEWIGGAR